MANLRPLLTVNSVPAISELVSKVPYDIIKVAKSKILPVSALTGFCLVVVLFVCPKHDSDFVDRIRSS